MKRRWMQVALVVSALVVGACGGDDKGSAGAGGAGMGAGGAGGAGMGAGGAGMGAGGAGMGAGGAGRGGAGGAGAGGAGMGAGGAGGAGGMTGGARLQVTLKFPMDLTGTPRALIVALVPALPVAGPPAEVVTQMAMPTIAAGSTLPLDLPVRSRGDFYVLAVLYEVGGGMFSPMAGVDYDAASMAKVTFPGTGSVDAGTLELHLHRMGDGH